MSLPTRELPTMLDNVTHSRWVIFSTKSSIRDVAIDTLDPMCSAVSSLSKPISVGIIVDCQVIRRMVQLAQFQSVNACISINWKVQISILRERQILADRLVTPFLLYGKDFLSAYRYVPRTWTQRKELTIHTKHSTSSASERDSSPANCLDWSSAN